jgi:hypothetical protein
VASECDLVARDHELHIPVGGAIGPALDRTEPVDFVGSSDRRFERLLRLGPVGLLEDLVLGGRAATTALQSGH